MRPKPVVRLWSAISNRIVSCANLFCLCYVVVYSACILLSTNGQSIGRLWFTNSCFNSLTSFSCACWLELASQYNNLQLQSVVRVVLIPKGVDLESY